jgi:hypothetical protein
VPAPHRGDTNKPLTIQGKANTAGTQTTIADQAKNSRKAHRRRQRDKQSPSRQKIQAKPTAAGKQTPNRSAGKNLNPPY